jgi:hypothetical protein
MTKKDFVPFTLYITGVAETLGHIITANQILMYFEVLKNEFSSIDEFKRASVELMKTWQYSYMPKPAHFLNALYPQTNIDIIAQKAWDSVMEGLENGVGNTRSAIYTDSLVPFIVESFLGGFRYLCKLDYSVLEFKKKEFINLYKNYAQNLIRKKDMRTDYTIKTLIDNPAEGDEVIIEASYKPIQQSDNSTQISNNKKKIGDIKNKITSLVSKKSM